MFFGLGTPSSRSGSLHTVDLDQFSSHLDLMVTSYGHFCIHIGPFSSLVLNARYPCKSIDCSLVEDDSDDANDDNDDDDDDDNDDDDDDVDDDDDGSDMAALQLWIHSHCVTSAAPWEQTAIPLPSHPFFLTPRDAFL